MRANMSILGLYAIEPGIFASITGITPSFDHRVTKEEIINGILLDCAELEILYPDAGFMKQMIEIWWNRELPIFQKLFKTTYLEYNPIWNKDGTVTETRKLTGLTTNTTQTHNVATAEGEENGTSSQEQNGSTSSTSENGTAAYNAETYTNRNKTTGNDTSSSAGVTNNTVSNSATNTADANGTSAEQHDNVEEYERREFGNIGVTTTQQMIKEERESVQFNIIDYISNSFKKRFCLLVY